MRAHTRWVGEESECKGDSGHPSHTLLTPVETSHDQRNDKTVRARRIKEGMLGQSAIYMSHHEDVVNGSRCKHHATHVYVVRAERTVGRMIYYEPESVTLETQEKTGQLNSKARRKQDETAKKRTAIDSRKDTGDRGRCAFRTSLRQGQPQRSQRDRRSRRHPKHRSSPSSHRWGKHQQTSCESQTPPKRRACSQQGQRQPASWGRWQPAQKSGYQRVRWKPRRSGPERSS